MLGAGLATLALFAAACNIVGEGTLLVANDQSGLGSNTTFRAFERESGDLYPPPGFLGIGVSGADFGSPPAFGMDGFLYLVSSDTACPMSEGAPEVYTPAQVTIHGVVSVNDGNVNQMLTVPDTVAGRPYWALIELNAFPDTGGGHLIHRCGEVTWE